MISRRGRGKLQDYELERLLYDHGVQEIQMETLRSQKKMNVRALRDVAKVEEQEDNLGVRVREALISVGELKSKSIRRKIVKMIFKSSSKDICTTNAINSDISNSRTTRSLSVFAARPSIIEERMEAMKGTPLPSSEEELIDCDNDDKRDDVNDYDHDGDDDDKGDDVEEELIDCDNGDKGDDVNDYDHDGDDDDSDNVTEHQAKGLQLKVPPRRKISSYSVALDGNRQIDGHSSKEEDSRDSLMDTLGFIFCSAPQVHDEPTYSVRDVEVSKEPPKEIIRKIETTKKKKKKKKKKEQLALPSSPPTAPPAPPRAARRQTAPAAVSSAPTPYPFGAGAGTTPSLSSSSSLADLSKIGGHPQLLGTYRQLERDGQALKIDTSNVNEILKTCTRDAVRISRLYLCLDLLDIGDQFEWKLFSGKPGGLDLVYTAYPPGYGTSSQVAIRSETYVHANWKKVFDIMTTDERTVLYDPNVNTYKQLRIDHEERVFARHYWFHAVWPTKARESVMVTTWERLEDQDGAILISTIGLPDCMAPRSDSCVRAFVCSSSCLIRPGYSPNDNGYRAPALVPEHGIENRNGNAYGDAQGRVKDDAWCHVTFCTHCDPGGGVPSFVTNMLGPSNSLMCLLAMKAIVEKEETAEEKDRMMSVAAEDGEREV